MTKLVQAGLLWLLAFLPVCGLAAERLTLVADDFPPFVYATPGGSVDGYAQNILQLMFDNAGLAWPGISIMPLPRARQLMETSPLTVMVALTRTPERETHFRWIGPWYDEPTWLFKLAANPASLRTYADLRHYSYGVKRGGRDEALLLKLGVPENHLFDSRHDALNLKKLLARRVDFVPFLPLEMDYYVRLLKSEAEPLQAHFQLSTSTPLYFAFPLHFPDALFQKLEKAFAELKDDVRIDALKRKAYPPSESYISQIATP